MTDYLFLLTISSVQSFIVQARKTQDLFAGSRILSELIKAGIENFEKTSFKENNPRAIFPILNDNDKQASLPNRFIRMVSIPETADKEMLKNKATHVVGAVKDKLKGLAKEALDKANVEVAPKGFYEQIENHLDIHWAFVKISDYGNYAAAYKGIESLIGSIKNVRNIKQYEYQGQFGEIGRKCSLDGENNALFFGEGTNARYLELNKLSNDCLISKSNPNEGLSAISLIKRVSKFYDQQSQPVLFESTAGISLMDDIRQINKSNDIEVKNSWFAYKHYFNDDFDEQLLFEENLNEEYFNKNGLKDYVKILKNIRDTHSKLKNHLNTKYYALILFDGDKMGKWLSGENLKKEYQGEKLAEFHNRFSGLLADFGKEAREEILNTNKNNGQTVYAGGDDFMGFVNLHHLFEVITKLRIEFDRMVNNELATYKEIGNHLTFSAGIVIAHYKTPLSEVLKKAREVEKKAKKEGDRNAFSLAVLKHSGEIHECVFKWDAESRSQNGVSNWLDIELIYKMLECELFSAKFINNLTIELYDLAGLNLGKANVSNSLIFAEIKRLLNRSFDNFNADSKLRELFEKNPDFFKRHNIYEKYLNKELEIFEVMLESLKRLYKSSQKNGSSTVENFIHAIRIADFTHRKS